ncbi:uncharacterized protein LOC126150994 [Schistocerca cancellata]|uniref:uncharacterized protein LOC126150994 n=1 Tax=Schistocerca cancellata TaxID=274614 RepID=UPI0021181257|nr:uncharacterized protein LOC126150994 [Schistocerca cancellata]
MASTAFVLNAGVFALALTVAIPIFPTLAHQTPCTTETTYPYGKPAVIVKTTVTCSPDHDGHKAGVCSKYDMEVTNHIIIAHHSQETEVVTTGEPLDSVGYINWDESAGPPSMEGECGAVWEATGKVRNIRSKVPLPFVCELPA